MKTDMVQFMVNQVKMPTNQDLSIQIVPNTSIPYYEYTVFKDNEVLKTNVMKEALKTTILLDETGTYQIEVVLYNETGQAKNVKSMIYQIDKEPPIIEVGETLLEMKQGDKLYPLEGIKVYDAQDGDLKSKVITNIDTLNLEETGIQKLIYTVSDEAGNVATKTVNLHITKNDTMGVILLQISIIVALIGAILLMLAYRKSIYLEKRIGKFGIDPIKDNSLSLFDWYHAYYQKLIGRMTRILSKSALLKKYAIRYEKYVGVIGHSRQCGLDYVSSKFLISFIFLGIAIFSSTIQLHFPTVYECVLPMVFGFFFPDVIYFSKYKIHRNNIENDLLQAIIIMNNAFKSGRSIVQAIELVTTELEGSIAEEFKKMRMEISFGLSVDVVFKRFSNRIQLEEVTYLTASLSILNQTGGNIIKVFSSIEQSLFNKKKLKLEMLSLTSSSKMIVYVLSVIPFLFIAFVSMISPGYFLPFLTSKLGLILASIMIIYYIVFLIVVRKVMKVRM